MSKGALLQKVPPCVLKGTAHWLCKFKTKNYNCIQQIVKMTKFLRRIFLRIFKIGCGYSGIHLWLDFWRILIHMNIAYFDEKFQKWPFLSKKDFPKAYNFEFLTKISRFRPKKLISSTWVLRNADSTGPEIVCMC